MIISAVKSSFFQSTGNEMPKRRLKGTVKSLQSHIDPEKEEQLRSIKIETENKVTQILRLIKSIKQTGKDGNGRKKTELIHLTEDFHQQYVELYLLYDNLRSEIKKKVHEIEDDESFSSSGSETEMYFSPKLSMRSSDSLHELQKQESSDMEDTVLKDKLTCTSEVRETYSMDSPPSFSQVPDSGEVIKDVGFYQPDIIEKLEGQVANLKLEVETLTNEKNEREEKFKSLVREVKELNEETSRLEGQNLELLDSLKKSEEMEMRSMSTIDRLKKEVDEFQEQLYLMTQDGSAQKQAFTEEIEYLRNFNFELESIMVETKTKEINDLKEKLSLYEQKDNEEKEGIKVQVNDLECEFNSLRSQKSAMEEEINSINSEKDALHGKISELEKNLEDKENELVVSPKKTYEDHTLLQVENENLRGKIIELEKNLEDKENELVVSPKKTNEDHTLLQVENENLRGKIIELEKNLEDKENELVDSPKKTYEDHTLLQVENENLQGKIIELEKTLLEKENEITSLKINESQRNETSHSEKNDLESQLAKEKEESSQSLTQMENKNLEFTSKIEDQRKSILELEEIVNNLKTENKQLQAEIKTNFHAGEKKIEEMAEEFRKQFEDNLRILSRRIRVAEQLHVENKEWYMKTRHLYEEENKDLKERVEKFDDGIRCINDITLTANDTLIALDAVGLRFEERAANFLNRISKVACEVKYAKDWIKRKNNVMSLVKSDLDSLVAQVGEKEGEILLYREKVWKSENRVRELEKIIHDTEDSMLGLKEEKREAIRQLCVWIEYHRSRSDYYKKTLYDLTIASKRPT